ncbi:hypothetical protein FSARC_10107 [Fusarium sarcochroum]|uniref:Uncharacterized protein n=1 Tax=Fusarium sarcochroum TaxID=1208366 RepID=A0A8H4TPZ8_9HYPO|nr:hypothetical protein FSARC_10107 [Fusarium sarcochroum]
MESLWSKHIATTGLETIPTANNEFKRTPASPCTTIASSANAYYNEAHWDHKSSEPLRMMAEDELKVELGPSVPPGEPAIPFNHTTLAGLLLEWPSVRELTKHHIERETIRYISEYPISQEQNRGALSVYERGEDSRPSWHVLAAIGHGNLDNAEDSSDMASTSPAVDWGQLGGLDPPYQVEYRGGVLASAGHPDFSETIVWAYVESFRENILNMHPIIQPKLLKDWVRHFLDDLSTPYPCLAGPQPSNPDFNFGRGSRKPEAIGSKRKRPSKPDELEPSVVAPGRIRRPDRSIHSALVLTVLALGKVCLHRDGVPDIEKSSESLPPGDPAI